MHLPVAWPLAPPTGVVHGARGAGHPLRVGAGVAGVVRAVRVAVVVGVAVVAGGSGCGWRGGLVRGQTEGVPQEHVHLLAHLVDGRLRAQRGRVRVILDPVAASVAQRAHQAVHVGLLEGLGLPLQVTQGITRRGLNAHGDAYGDSQTRQVCVSGRACRASRVSKRAHTRVYTDTYARTDVHTRTYPFAISKAQHFQGY